MYNISLIATIVIAVFFTTACLENKKTEPVLIPQAQLDALQKANNIEVELTKAQQNKNEKYKNQGL